MAKSVREYSYFTKEETHEGHRDIRPQSQRKDGQKYDKLFLYV